MNAQEILSNQARQYNFYQLVNTLHRFNETDPESEAWEQLYTIIFTASANMGFAAADINWLKFRENRVLMETTFLGLTGSQSPLPNFFLDALATDDDDGIRKDFLDFFNHRAITILYRVWRKYRYYEYFKPNATDRISQRLFSFIGLGVDSLRSEKSINWCKMLAYIGMLAGRNRSSQVVSGVISHYFDVHSSVEEWIVRYVDIPGDQKTALGGQNCALGETTILGSRIKDCSSKFILTLHMLTFRRFKDFLPTGSQHKTLQEVVEFILRTQMAYDLNLELAPNEAPPLNLTKEQGGYLGWTSFMGAADEKKHVLIQVRR